MLYFIAVSYNKKLQIPYYMKRNIRYGVDGKKAAINVALNKRNNKYCLNSETGIILYELVYDIRI